MAYASRSGRARTSSSAPMAHAICDRCGFRYNHASLSWQFDWRGAALGNTRALVCPSCLDAPQEQQRAIVIPADPAPISQPRTQNFMDATTNYHTVTQPAAIDAKTGIPVPGTTTFLTTSGANRVQQPIGISASVDPNAVVPLSQGAAFRVQLPIMSLVSNGTDQITATCSAAHGLIVGSMVVVEGALLAPGSGAFTINSVPTATMFSYQIDVTLPMSSLLSGSTLVFTASIGVPLGFTQLPKIGNGIAATATYPVLPFGVFDQTLFDQSIWS